LAVQPPLPMASWYVLFGVRMAVNEADGPHQV
jgi:hypothetical protein